MNLHMFIYVYIYLHTYIYTHIDTYRYIYTCVSELPGLWTLRLRYLLLPQACHAKGFGAADAEEEKAPYAREETAKLEKNKTPLETVKELLIPRLLGGSKQ